MAGKKFVEDLDHPVFFLLAVTLGVCALKLILHWALQSAGMPGSARIFA